MADLSSLNMPSGRDPEDVYASVQTRGRTIRNRRYAILGTVATVLVIAIAVPVASALGSNGDGQRVNVANQPDDTTTTVPADDTTTTTAATPTTTAAPSTSTTTRNATATTAAPTTTAPRYQACPRDAIEATTTTDRQTYPVGTQVVATGTLRNTSTQPCYMPSLTNATVSDSNGEPVLFQEWSNDTDPNYHATATPPGSTRTYNWTWNQRACSYTQGGQCGQANPGTYTIQLTWGSYGNANKATSAPFTITAT